MLASPQVRGSRTLTGGPSPISQRVPALTGMRAVAALLVVGTHAAFATGKLTHGYLGAIYARLEIGVAIFFVLSGFLLFRPWALAAATGSPPPLLTRYTRHRLRRIMPGYVVAVLATFAVYLVFTPGPNPGQTWHGLLRYLTLTQIYTDNYLVTYLHTGLSQMWSLAVEVSFYAVLPGLAFVLLRVRHRAGWRPARTLTGLAALAAVTPAWLVVAHTTDALPNAAGMWLPAHLACFAAGMALAVLGIIGTRWRARVTLPSAAALYLIVSTPAGGAILGPDPAWVPVTKALLYAAIAMLVVGTAGTRVSRPVCADVGQQADGVARRDLVRDLPAACGRDGGDDESGAPVAAVHRVDGRAVCDDTRRDDPICVGASPADQLPQGRQ